MIEIEVTDLDLFSKRHILPLELKKKWVEALKSGKFKHGRKYLCKDNKFCCLGVLCEIVGIEKKSIELNFIEGSCWAYGGKVKDYEVISDEILRQYLGSDGDFIGFLVRKNGKSYNSLAYLNDSEDDFKEVCRVIEILF